MPAGVVPTDGELVLGLYAFTALNSGTTAAPVYTELLNTKDETLNMESALSDVTTRAANGWRLQVGTLSDASVDTQALYKAGTDANFDTIRDAFLNKTRILMGFFDGDPAGAGAGNTVSGLTGGFSVTNFTQNRALEEAIMVDVTYTVREDDAGNGPVWTKYATPPT